MTERIGIFNAGPAVLPEEVLLEAQKDLFNYKGCGQSVMEMSHRSPVFQGIIDDAMARLKDLMGLGDDYDILFLLGGASTQFLMIPMNLCPDDKTCNYVNTGTWATKALKEAKKLGKKMHIAASSEDKAFTYIPKEMDITDDAAYLHITTNNTIRGTEYHWIPDVNIPLIADVSSNFLSKPMDFKKFDMIYGGAQKNIGPAGMAFVVISKKIQEKLPGNVPTMLDYKTHISKGSMFNTPPCWTIYIVGLVAKWIQDNGGLVGIEKINKEKAGYIYNAMDRTDFYSGPVVFEDRSLMNIPFRLPTEELEKKFIAEAAQENFIGLKGHRSVGGCRASVYNSLPLKWAQKLGHFMDEFAKNNG
ncbi:MAG: 3-phosphoserine/phosphohydroxythreonine transaminase [Candidatus Cloacimonetes bacterium]|nr:3-phosphoserine/phosphohydroxythreonine transaminase [Candidatus Cloacimonadota bacterium]